MVKVTEQREAGRRAAILNAAKVLLVRRGLADTSMADIVAQRPGMGEGH
jgi:AcrR family transcriptional regulator